MEIFITILFFMAFFFIINLIVGFIIGATGKKVRKYTADNEDERRTVECKESFDYYCNHIMKLKHTSIIKDIKEYRSKAEYEEYLLSPEWNEKKLARMELDNYLCQYCGNEVATRTSPEHSPNVHHMHYKSLTKEDVNTDIITLCNYCHNDLHKNFTIQTMEVEIRTNGKFV